MTTWARAEQWQPPPQPALFGEISADGTRIILIAQGNSWDQQVIGQRLSHVTALLGKVPGMPSVVTLPLSWASVSQVAHSFNGAYGSARWVPLPRLHEWILAEFTRRTAVPKPLKAEFPAGLVLRDYQQEGAAMIAAAHKFLLLDEPGTGKTCSTIAGLAEIQARGSEIFPAVIIVPSWGVATHWQREVAAWKPGWRTVKWGGPGRDISRALDQAGILITTYSTARIDAGDARSPLAALRPVTVVGDEIHLCKGSKVFTEKGNSTVSAAYRRICAHAVNVIELSGTLITRDTGDAYVPMAAAWPLDFPDRKRFTNRYLQVTNTEYGEVVEGLAPLAEPEFRNVLTGSVRRVAKADVLKSLPPKIYSVRYVDIPAEWREAYDGMERDMLAELPDNEGELPAFDSLVKFGRLSQLACSAADVEVTEKLDELTGMMKKHYKVTLKTPSWKTDELLEILAERPGHPVVSFTPARQLALIAGQAARKAGYRVGYYTGIGDGITEKSRQADKDALQAGQLDLLSATTGAGGTGLTLTAAGTAVFLQRPWLGESIQSEDRVHRWGSEIHEHGVEIIDIVARDSIDSRRRKLLREHGIQLAAFVQDSRLIRGLLGGLPA